jgi:hypothetical protein
MARGISERGTRMTEFTMRCLKPNGALGLLVVRRAFSVDDALTDARIILAHSGFATAELWTGDQLLTRLAAAVG